MARRTDNVEQSNKFNYMFDWKSGLSLCLTEDLGMKQHRSVNVDLSQSTAPTQQPVVG